MQFLVRLITPALISLVLGLSFRGILKEQEKGLKKSFGQKHIIIRPPKAYFWGGFLAAAFCCTCLFMITFFPNGTETLGVLLFEYIAGSFMALGGIYLMLDALFSRIEVFEDEDYFIYGTMFKRRKIQYSDCVSYRDNKNRVTFDTLEIQLKNGKKLKFEKFTVINIEALERMLRKNKVKRVR